MLRVFNWSLISIQEKVNGQLLEATNKNEWLKLMGSVWVCKKKIGEIYMYVYIYFKMNIINKKQ